jgi:hypothetical protein
VTFFSPPHNKTNSILAIELYSVLPVKKFALECLFIP